MKEYNDFKNMYLLIGSIAGNVGNYPLVSQSFHFLLYLCKYKNIRGKKYYAFVCEVTKTHPATA